MKVNNYSSADSEKCTQMTRTSVNNANRGSEVDTSFDKTIEYNVIEPVDEVGTEADYPHTKNIRDVAVDLKDLSKPKEICKKRAHFCLQQ